MEHPDRAAVYYGHAVRVAGRAARRNQGDGDLQSLPAEFAAPQPPERIARYAFLQQKQNHPEEAIEQYIKAAEMFSQADRMEDALFCWERTAQLEPENIEATVETGGNRGATG